jgi:hypothetical protein
MDYLEKMNAKEIHAGKCYVTSSEQVRRVLVIDAGKVTYESRGKRAVAADKIWGPKVTVPIDQFADLVTKEVAVDYDPDYAKSDKPV